MVRSFFVHARDPLLMTPGIGQNGATYANIDELLRRAIEIGARNEIGTIREKMGKFGEGY